MKRWRHAILAIAALLIAGAILALVLAGAERRAALDSMLIRLAELRAQRLDPRDVDAVKRALAAPFDPQTGLLAADAEAIPHLEAFIRTAALDHKAEIQLLNIGLDSMNSKLPALRGTLHLVINAESIGPIVRSLEAGPPVVFLERLRIANRPPAEGGEAPMLDLTASILVYRDLPKTEKPAP